MNKKPEEYKDLLPLSPVAFHILFALADGEKHGYALRKEVEKVTEGAVVIHIGSLYNQIRRLLKSGLITESNKRPPVDVDDSRRRYYRLTDKGKKALLEEADRVRKLVTLLDEKKLFNEI